MDAICAICAIDTIYAILTVDTVCAACAICAWITISTTCTIGTVNTIRASKTVYAIATIDITTVRNCFWTIQKVKATTSIDCRKISWFVITKQLKVEINKAYVVVTW